jgi:hypothetical protein
VIITLTALLTLNVLSFFPAEVDDEMAFGDDDDLGEACRGLDIGDSDDSTLAGSGSRSRNADGSAFRRCLLQCTS